MLEISAHIILVVLLGIAFYQDWKYRAIVWLLFPLLAINGLLLFWMKEISFEIITFNLAFLTVVIGSLFLYISIRKGKLTNIFKSDLGLGDVLFLMAVSPLFAERNFILFFISGMFLSAIIHLLLQRFGTDPKIPLAGYLAIYLIALKGIGFISNNDLFYTSFLT